MSSNISDKDKKDWEKFLSTDETLPNKDRNSSKKIITKIKSCDLHGYSLEEANEKIRKLIINSYESGVTKLIIVTGKGLHSQNEKDPYVSKDLGILKYSIPEYIKSKTNLSNYISSINDADKKDGGQGTLHIRLKKL